MDIPLRVRALNQRPEKNGVAVYLMSRDQRVQDNHALIETQNYALRHSQPLLVLFVLYPNLGHRTRQQFLFMIEGLKEVEKNLNKYSIPFLVLMGKTKEQLSIFNQQHSISALFFDFSPLREPQQLRKTIAQKADFSCFEVDTHNIIPAWQTSQKEEFAAHTIRPKIHKLLPDYLHEHAEIQKHPFSFPGNIKNDWGELTNAVQAESIPSYKPSHTPGEKAARNHLTNFLNADFLAYSEKRNDPAADCLSGLSPSLHFGHISSLRVALEVQRFCAKDANGTYKESQETLFEEMIVRKELSDNFCLYNSQYNSLKGARDWAQKTLYEHESDSRPHVYSIDELENAQTHDQAWNAAQIQMTTTGKMHGYMRMYWAKKILEWSPSAEEALRRGIYLNDKYELDGYDPNGYTGIMWSIAGVHDRPWTERPIFGKIRYMNFNGLKRKFNIQAYIDRWTEQNKLL